VGQWVREMIVFENVTKRYGADREGAAVALADVTLTVPAGGVTAVVGPNGAGKSTLLGLALGFLRQTSGSVTIGGSRPRSWVRRHGASYLPERFAPPPEWRIDRTLRAFARLEGLGRPDADSVADACLARFGLSDHAGKNVAELSRGLLQRMGLAQALLARREIVVFDEPTEGLDPPGRALFREAVKELRDHACTVLIASHDLAELERVADRAFVFDAGKLRDSIELRATVTERSAWVISLAASLPSMIDVFPDAVVLGAPTSDDGPAEESIQLTGAATDSPTRVRYAVTVRDARDLTSRLATIITSGAVIHGVSPASPSLEDRLRQALQRPDTPAVRADPTSPSSQSQAGPR